MHGIHRNPLAGVVAVFALALSGCGGGAEDKLPRQAISGKVTLDDKPLARGSITFDPADTSKPDVVSAGAVITDGSYSISKAQGLTPGNYRVSILDVAEGETVVGKEAPGAPPKAKKGAAKNAIPPQYNSQSKLTAEVKAGSSDSFNFDLKSK